LQPNAHERMADFNFSNLSNRVFLQIPLLLLPLLLGCVLARSFWESSSHLYEDVRFKLCVTAVLLATAIAYVAGAWASHPCNDEGADVARGTVGVAQRFYYCARALPIPGTDGVCGPNNGPQCASCLKFQQNKARWPFLPHMFALHPALKLGQWVAPCACMALFFVLWASPERDMNCGTEAWGPMVPWIGDLYLPTPGSKGDHRLLGDLLGLSMVNPVFWPPRLLLPTMNHKIPPYDRFVRTEYFVTDMFFLTAATCALLEGVRWLCQGKARDASTMKALLLDPESHKHGGLRERKTMAEREPSAAERVYIGAFVAWYLIYQVVLYMLMDFGVSHGLMNLTTGIAWELWVPFVEFVLLTALCTGIPRYVLHLGAGHEHPSPLLLMQLVPWLGNELHIMKDHIATALCFAAAHCSDGPLRFVGLLLGYLSIASTVFPIVLLLADKASFTALRSSHWPIAEAAFVVPQTGTKEEKFWKQAVQTAISATTHDKYVRAIAGEVPHATLHVVFAFFFGGGLFIMSAIIMSAVKILAIPIGRKYLRMVIPNRGCTEVALLKFLSSAGGLLDWQGSGIDPIAAAFKHGWWEVLADLQDLCPELNEAYAQYSRVSRTNTANTARVSRTSTAEAPALFNSLPPPEGDEEPGDGEPVCFNADPGSEDGGDIRSSSSEEAEGPSRLQQLLNMVAARDSVIFMAMLTVLNKRLGWMDPTEASYVIMGVLAGEFPAEALDGLKEMIAMGAKAPTEDILGSMESAAVDEEKKQEVRKVVESIMGRQKAQTTDRDITVTIGDASDREEDSLDSEDAIAAEVAEIKERSELQVVLGSFSVALGVPLLCLIALTVL